MPIFDYLPKKSLTRALSVVVTAEDEDEAQDLLHSFMERVGVTGNWSEHFDLHEVVEDDEECEYCGHGLAYHSVDGGCQNEYCKCSEKGTWGAEEDDSEGCAECGCSRDDHEGGVGACVNCTDEDDDPCENFEEDE